MIREVIVVEGKSDVAAINRSLEADCLVTGGFSLSEGLLSQIEAAYHRRGLVIFTDPDSAGERIRNFLRKRFPRAAHAFVPRCEATGDDGRIGVEKASPEQIRAALSKARAAEVAVVTEFYLEDLLDAGLSGGAGAADKRAFLGVELGLGWANAKTFLHRLNTYGVSRGEFHAALEKWEESHV
jgi:ribonuclease M5